jgi:phytanoyl-CoA hydroxylase
VSIKGHIDRCDKERLEGWVFSAAEPLKQFTLQIFTGDLLLGETAADRLRPDLQAAGYGSGRCAFSYQMPHFLPKGALKNIRMRITDSIAWMLPDKETTRDPDPEPDEEAATEPGAAPAPQPFVSKFGGLWIDRTDWIDRLSTKHRKGEINDDLAMSIFRFVRDGHLVFRSAVPQAIVNALNDAIERVWNNAPKGQMIETFEPDGAIRIIPPDIAFREGRTKLLDLYAFSNAARRAIAAPALIAFLAAIFEDTPKVFQSLTLWNGSPQPMHKDSAYVKIEPNPMAMAATWLALEDVRPGTGEPEYYVGSHRAPDYMFRGMSKWMEGYAGEHHRFLQSLNEDAEKYGHTRASFLAKKGDVLLWHADLAHCDAKITRQGATRRSMLTHFTAAQQQPLYRRHDKQPELVSGSCSFVSQFGDVV